MPLNLAGMLAVLAVAFGMFLATDVRPASAVDIPYEGQGTTNGVCDNIGEFDDLDPAPGQQGWLFILTSPDTGPWQLTANFSDGQQVVNGVQQGMGGSIHFVVYTSVGATLSNAGTFATNGTENSVLTVSHCEVNEEEAPTLVINKVCVGGNGETNFTFNLTPGTDDPTLGCAEQSETIDLEAGVDYTLTEDMPLPPGWTLTNVTCTGIEATQITDGVSFTPEDSETIECTFRDTFEEAENPTIVINKVCVGGTGPDFTENLDPNGSIPDPTLGCGESSGVIGLVVDTDYTLTEGMPLPEGWDLTSVDCTGVEETVIQDGVTFTPEDSETIECTFTNTFEEAENPTLTIFKECSGAADTDFTFTVSPAVMLPFPTFGCGENSGTVDLEAGTPYTVTEDMPLPAGWTLANVNCTGIDASAIENGVSFTPVDSETIECTFTDRFVEAKNPTLIIKKVCIDGDGPDFGFDLTPGTADPTLGCGESSETIDLVADTNYTLTEDMPLPPGWELAGVDCTNINESAIEDGVSFTPVDSESIVCIFTDKFREVPPPEGPTLRIVKQCIGGNGVTDFSFDVSPDEPIPFPTFGCGENSGTIALEAGVDYEVTEVMPLPNGWTLSNVNCTGIGEASITDGVSFVPSEGDVIHCTFANVFSGERIVTTPTPTPTTRVPEVTVTPPAPPREVAPPVSGIRAPSTGSGGLAADEDGTPWTVVIAAFITAALSTVAFFWPRAQR